MIRGCSKCSEDLGRLWVHHGAWPKEESKSKRLSKLAIKNCYSLLKKKKKKAKKVAQDVISWAVPGLAPLRIWVNFPDFFPVTALLLLGPSSWSPLSSQGFQSVFASLHLVLKTVHLLPGLGYKHTSSKIEFSQSFLSPQKTHWCWVDRTAIVLHLIN